MFGRGHRGRADNRERAMAKLVYSTRIGATAKLSVAVSGFVFSADTTRILLVERRDNGRWSLPSGSMEAGESIAEACAREVLEETGLETEIVRIVGVYSDPNCIVVYPDGNRFQTVEIDLEMRIVGGALKTSSETSRVEYLSIAELDSVDLMESETPRVLAALSSEGQYIK